MKDDHGALGAAVREAILSTEHLALSRRYRTFVMAHVHANYFRQAAPGKRPIARHELEPACARPMR